MDIPTLRVAHYHTNVEKVLLERILVTCYYGLTREDENGDMSVLYTGRVLSTPAIIPSKYRAWCMQIFLYWNNI